jgi:sirohydrochlorin ferrochelatase
MAEEEKQQKASPDELAAQLREYLKQTRVADLIVQQLYPLASLGFWRLSKEGRDLPQARLAIEALRALLQVLEGEVPKELLRDLRQTLANLQLAYAEAAKESGRGEGGGGDGAG